MNSDDTHQIVLVVDDDVMITQGLAAGLSRPGRTIVTANDVESAEMVVEWLHPSHVVSDVRLTGPFGYEGLDFIRFIKKQSPDSRIILMTGDAPEALQMEASERGAVGFLQKPFEVADLDSTLNLMAPPRRGSPDWPDIIQVPTIDEIVSGGGLFTVFQPIVRLGTGERVGYEALARYETSSPLRDPVRLFNYAARKQRIADLELASVASTLASAARLSHTSPIFMNIHPAVFSGPRLPNALVSEAEKASVPLNRIVLEITEQGSLADDRSSLDSIKKLQSAGVRFAFDDVGIAYSHLPFIDRVRPAFLKVSQHFGTGFESDDMKLKLVRNLLSLAKDFDSELILEGIETAATAAAANEMGIKYGQGYHFGRPAKPSTFESSGFAAQSN